MPVVDRERLLRLRDGSEQRVTSFELFFDLVFVFAIIQLSPLLLDHLTLQGAFETAILLTAVWWSWMYTTWMTNRFDPDQIYVRLLLIGLHVRSSAARRRRDRRGGRRRAHDRPPKRTHRDRHDLGPGGRDRVVDCGLRAVPVDDCADTPAFEHRGDHDARYTWPHGIPLLANPVERCLYAGRRYHGNLANDQVG